MSNGNKQRLDQADIAGPLKRFLENECLPDLNNSCDSTLAILQIALTRMENELLEEIQNTFELNSITRHSNPQDTMESINKCLENIKHPDNPFHIQIHQLESEQQDDQQEFNNKSIEVEKEIKQKRNDIENELQTLGYKKIPPPGLPRISFLRFLAGNVVYFLALPFTFLYGLIGGDARQDYRDQMNYAKQEMRNYRAM